MMAALLLAIMLGGCVGIVDDYSKTALAFGRSASGNTIENLSAAHDLEAAGYAAAYCGQPRIGAVERRYRDPAVMMQRLMMCEAEREIGFAQ